MKIPEIGLGTWDLRGKECTKAIELGLELGYRHIDTAHVYENHAAIKKAIKDFNREELFLTTKLALDQIHLSKIDHSVEVACDLALKELGVDYVDLYLLHWPDHTQPLGKILQAMELLVEKKKASKIGVSNFNIHHLEDLRKEGCKPSFNQVEFHPYLYQQELLDYCKEQQIQIIAYRPLGKGKLLKEPLLEKIGHSHKKSPAQVALRWLVQKKIPAIPKAASKQHLLENLQIFDFKLTESEMDYLDRLHRGKRFCMPENEEFSY